MHLRPVYNYVTVETSQRKSVIPSDYYHLPLPRDGIQSRSQNCRYKMKLCFRYLLAYYKQNICLVPAKPKVAKYPVNPSQSKTSAQTGGAATAQTSDTSVATAVQSLEFLWFM